jgi:hypothetical protein
MDRKDAKEKPEVRDDNRLLVYIEVRKRRVIRLPLGHHSVYYSSTVVIIHAI